MFGLGRKTAATDELPSLAVANSETLQHAAGTLIANIGFSSVDTPIRSIVFTGSVPNEGKTTVALATAIAIGQSGRRCLLVEGDMRRSSLRGVLGAHAKRGMYALVTGRCGIDDALCPTPLKNVSFLDAESGIPNPDTVIASGQFCTLLKSLEEQFRYVIIDTPPVVAFPDAALAASVADATLLVVREGHASKRDILYSLEQLKNADANVLGTVFNGIKQRGGSYGYGYSKYYSTSGDGPALRVGASDSDEGASRQASGGASLRHAATRPKH